MMSSAEGEDGLVAGLPALFAVGEDVALDFLNSLAAPRGNRREWLGDGEKLLTWLEAMGLVEKAEALKYFEVGEFDRVAAKARELREEVRGVVAELARGGSAKGLVGRLELLRGVLKRENRFRELGAVKGKFEVRQRMRWERAEEVLLPVADAVVELLVNGDFSLVHRCANERCTLWFYDRTKSHRRRWCSTALCGNRAKVAAHRARLKAGE